ncbi:hypothetical protein [Silvanigrella aquatica]|nr:hypothetical protein [Silvanigrella aquatica]
MVKLIFIFLIIFYSFNIFAANIPVYDWSSIDQADTELPRKYNLSLSSGYSQLVISGIYYNGYNIFTDLLVLLSKRGLIGFGFRYENTSSTSGALQDPQAFGVIPEKWTIKFHNSFHILKVQDNQVQSVHEFDYKIPLCIL